VILLIWLQQIMNIDFRSSRNPLKKRKTTPWWKTTAPNTRTVL